MLAVARRLLARIAVGTEVSHRLVALGLGGPARTRMRSHSFLSHRIVCSPHATSLGCGRSAWYILIVSSPGDELLFITGFVTDRFD